MEFPDERADDLWWLAAPLGVWAAHFGASYALLVLGCPRLDDALVHAGLAVLTVAALGPLGWLAWRSLRRYRRVAAVEVDAPTEASRHRFMALTILLTAVLGLLGVLYTAGSAALVGVCP